VGLELGNLVCFHNLKLHASALDHLS
jgi:hypothetical protein